MSAETLEMVRLFESLPMEKRGEVADFARFLFESSEDARWEEIIESGKPRTALEAFARESALEGFAEMDSGKL